MATRIPRIAADKLLKHATRRAPINLTTCQPCRLRTRPLHTSAPRRTSPDTNPRSASDKPASSNVRTARVAPVGWLVGGGLVASFLALSQNHDTEHLPEASVSPSGDNRDPSIPRFRLSDVRKHGPDSSEPWVTFEDKVYNITDWIEAHPGGDVILRAAGASLEPYWNIFSIHNAPHVKEILGQYMIGFIDAADLGPDGRPAAESIEDPFEDDPVRDPRLITHTLKPRNAEPPNEELDRTFYTPNDLFYIRHHMWVPVVEEAKADEFALTVELPDGEVKQYTIGELKAKFPMHKVTAVLQCSGNRRNDMTRHAGKTNGLQWGVGAISNAEWEGVRLSDVLADAGLNTTPDQPEANSLHAQFTGAEAYGASIPLSKALSPTGDVLLAFNMNGEPLPRDHGFPLRAVVPGNVAARSVKWLNKIVISDEESPSQWQRRDYKSFGPNEGPNPDWEKAPSIQEMPITSAITGVWVGDCVRKGKVPWMGATENHGTTNPCPETTPDNEPIALQGYAYSGGGRKITRVDVSLDGGATWDQAELVDDCSNPATPCHGNKTWGWTRWRYEGTLPVLSLLPTTTATPALPPALQKVGQDCEDGFGRSRGLLGKKDEKNKKCTTLIVKATDESYNTQPESHKGIYNVRGNLATAWHRVKICPECTKGNGKPGGLTWSTGETYGCGFRREAEEVRVGMERAASLVNGKK
ncbi:Oxidoreductase, molybdopterin-binding domain-containing protein [Apiosordaria backusii]|uniref:Nitrate reductase [NADPH] n=1 Tax=Apiosordaria backusii TaxID=314023 RepID=A0AA40EDK3_9PEZI|nr:Oxidoreductase, molybdopterin-binding domain-containing protein [Apiosordaria backusii]